jgi:hypothetical protein
MPTKITVGAQAACSSEAEIALILIAGCEQLTGVVAYFYASLLLFIC